jgi:hypothetical protein
MDDNFDMASIDKIPQIILFNKDKAEEVIISQTLLNTRMPGVPE